VLVPCFLLFLCFRKVTQKIFLELDETKASRPEFHRSFQRTKEETARPRSWPRPLCVRSPRSTPDDVPSPIKTPRQEKPKNPITFLEHIAIHCRCRSEDREGPEALPGTLPERKITTGGLSSSPCLPPA
jgi:hypothetical protein